MPTEKPAGALILRESAIRLRILSDGRAGHDAQALGIAEAMGLAPEIRRIHPRKLFGLLAPFGPLDPREKETEPLSPIAPPWPDIALAAGRRTLPYLRRIKRVSLRRVFTVYVNAPATGSRAADLIVAPLHDGMFARNVFTPTTPANRVTSELLARLRLHPDPRVEALPRPRAAVLIGGDSRHFRFAPTVVTALQEAIRALQDAGYSVMATASQRTPPAVVAALAPIIAERAGWFWSDGAGENPYFSMLAKADLILVTADSVSMVGEAVATGAPVHIFAPQGRSAKIADYLERLQRLGAVRPWSGTPERWRYTPINATPAIAEAVLRAYENFRGTTPLLPEPEEELEEDEFEDEDCEEGENDGRASG